MLLNSANRRYDLEGIGIRQGNQPAGKVRSWDSSKNSLVLHLATPVNLKCAVGGRPYGRRVVPGDIHIIPEGTQICIDFSGPCELILLSFSRQSLHAICHDLGRNGDISLTFQFSLRDAQILGLAQTLQEELRSGCERGEAYMRQLVSTVIRYIASTYSTLSVARAKPPGGLPPIRLRFVLDHIHTHIRTQLFSKDLAKLVQMSPQHFGNLFRKSTGRAPYEYILHERIEYGKRLLAETTLPIMEIAIEAGFAHHSHFGDTFRQLTGMTPKQYRQRHESFAEPRNDNRDRAF
jgi:AraC family transcriptional regulator